MKDSSKKSVRVSYQSEGDSTGDGPQRSAAKCSPDERPLDQTQPEGPCINDRSDQENTVRELSRYGYMGIMSVERFLSDI